MANVIPFPVNLSNLERYNQALETVSGEKVPVFAACFIAAISEMVPQQLWEGALLASATLTECELEVTP